MKVVLRLIFSVLAVLVLVAALFSFWQTVRERSRLFHDLERRSYIFSDNLSERLLPQIERNDNDGAILETLESFVRRERILGASIHDEEGRLKFATNSLPESATQILSGTDFLNEARESDSRYGVFENHVPEKVFRHVFTLETARGNAFYVSLFHHTGYIFERIDRMRLTHFARVLMQAFFIAVAVILIIYFNIMTPIRKTAEWIKRIRLGENPGKPPVGEKLFAPLVKEVSHMAKSLTMARQAAEEEARLGLNLQSIWTPDRLKEFVRVKLQGRPLFVISNREPYMHVKKGKEIECVVPASGLVTAIEPVLKACGGTWIAQGTGDADRETVDDQDKLRVPPEEPQYTLRRVWVDPQEDEGFYNGFSNEGLWPLCHIAHTRPIFRPNDWLQYEAVNKKFAQIALQEMEGTVEPCVLIQDYHFALLPRLIKNERPDARIALFWHIPWPNPESFGICPWQKEVLQGMLGADIIGFHTQYHCNNFMETVDRILESRIDYEQFSVNREGHTTSVKPFPISIAFLNGSARPHEMTGTVEDKTALLKPYGIRADYLGVGVDRLDYTKGILERFRAVEVFLDSYPEYQGLFTFVELAAPSRSLIPKYQQFVSEVEAEVERINQRFKGKNWKPILFLKKHHSHKDIAPFYKAADVCVVTSLHDGMNLVAKEFVQARDDESGTLILSQFTGASRELTDALIINPYDIAQTAEAIKAALEMSADEKSDRMRRMRNVLKDRNIYRWAADLVNELAQIRLPSLQVK